MHLVDYVAVGQNGKLKYSPPQLSSFSDNAILFNPAEIAWTPSEGTQIRWTNLLHKNRNSNSANAPSPGQLMYLTSTC